MLAFKYLTALALSVVSVTGSPVKAARDSSQSLGAFYAYGTGVNGLRLWYGNGVAYVGNSPPSNTSNAANVTLTKSDTSITAVVNTTDSLDPNVGSSNLFINTTSGAFSEVGFTNDTSTAGHTTTGFGLLGTMLIWTDSDGDIKSSWYAEPVSDEAKTFKLLWNTDLVSSDTAVAVTLKKTAPSTSS